MGTLAGGERLSLLDAGVSRGTKAYLGGVGGFSAMHSGQGEGCC